MNAVYRNESVAPALFAEADAQYSAMKAALTTPEFEETTEAEAERWLMVEQRELMRRLHQAFMTLRGQARAEEPVVGVEGETRTYMREGMSRNVESIFGTVKAERTGYAGRDLSTLHPVDAALNLPKRKYSLEVERQVSKAAARMSFDEALEQVGSLTGAHVPKRQAEQIVQRAARDFEAFYASAAPEPKGPTSDLLVLSFDQKGVVLRREDLKAATQKAAARISSKMDTRRSKGEPKRGRKRMAAVAAVYTVAPYTRTAKDVIAGLRHVREVTNTPRPRPESKRVWATLRRELKQVIAEAFAEAAQRDPTRSKRWIVLIDGDRKLIHWVRAEARRRGVAITVVLDFIHALEYLWNAAHVFFDEGTPEIEAWVLKRLERMLQGHVSQVVAGMTRMATARKLSANARKPIDTAAKYLLKRKDMMRYDELLALGTPIATGVIEGACRHLINDRMDRTGACWGLATAEAVLRLRSLISSGDFEQYWIFHEQVEAYLNHALRYADQKVPSLVMPTRKPKLRLVKSGD